MIYHFLCSVQWIHGTGYLLTHIRLIVDATTVTVVRCEVSESWTVTERQVYGGAETNATRWQLIPTTNRTNVLPYNRGRVVRFIQCFICTKLVFGGALISEICIVYTVKLNFTSYVFRIVKTGEETEKVSVTKGLLGKQNKFSKINLKPKISGGSYYLFKGKMQKKVT